MLKIFGMPVSSPTNKVRYVANYLNIPYEFCRVNLATGEHKKPEFLKLNPLGRVPAIDDNGFHLAESNAIIRYLANKHQSACYPSEPQSRAVVDQWIEYASHHVMMALSRIMFNTYFYKLSGTEKDERSLKDGKMFINQYLPVIEKQLAHQAYLAGQNMTLADIAMLAALDTCEASQVSLSDYPHITKWQQKLMKESFYQACHKSFSVAFNELMQKSH